MENYMKYIDNLSYPTNSKSTIKFLRKFFFGATVVGAFLALALPIGICVTTIDAAHVKLKNAEQADLI